MQARCATSDTVRARVVTTEDITAPRNILILEDEMLIALDIEQMLVALGHNIAALCTRIPAALVAASGQDIDFAVLDINVAGVLSFPVARILRDRKVPFLFLSGYGARGLIDGFTDAPVLTKPFSQGELEQMVASALAIDAAA